MHSPFPSHKDAAPPCPMHLVVVVCYSSSAQAKNGQLQEKKVQDPKKNLLLGVRTPNTVIIFVPGPTQHLSSEREKTETAQMTLPASCCRLVARESWVFLDTTRYICNKKRDLPCTVRTTPSGLQTLAFFCVERVDTGTGSFLYSYHHTHLPMILTNILRLFWIPI